MTLPTDWVPGEVPPADDLTAAWWDATRDHRLTVQTCAACERVQHPPRALCTGCGRTDALGQRDATGAGTVDACTVVHRAPRSGVETPYVLARVRLVEGPVLLTRLSSCEPRIGDRVVVDWVDLPDGRALPVFTPVSHLEENA